MRARIQEAEITDQKQKPSLSQEEYGGVFQNAVREKKY